MLDSIPVNASPPWVELGGFLDGLGARLTAFLDPLRVLLAALFDERTAVGRRVRRRVERSR